MNLERAAEGHGAGEQPIADRIQLEQHYHSTAYCADTPGGRLTMRIGESSLQLDDLLDQHHAVTWAFISAHNPGSRLLPVEENRRRHQHLEKRIKSTGYPYYQGAGVGDAGTWPPEASLLILGISRLAAESLAREFQQLAFVAGERKGPAKLIWIDDP